MPKLANPYKIEDYRPISMVRSVYKIISKILANRFKSVIGLIASEL